MYLEIIDEDDWIFYLMEGFYKYFGEFYELNFKRVFKGMVNEYYYLWDDDYEWFKNKVCKIVWFLVLKGGMVLWDLWLIYVNVKFMRNWCNFGRWCYIIFCCMMFVIWVIKDDYIDRKLVFEFGSMIIYWFL